MAEERFDLIFRGDIVLGQSLGVVKQRLQQLFKADAQKVDQLFSGRPVALKRQLDRATAEKYQQVLHKAGAQVTLRAASDASAKVAPQKPAGHAPSRAAAESGASRLSLAPVGGMLLKESERVRLTPVSVDTSALSLRPPEGYLLDTEEVTREPVAPVSVPEFEVAEVGELLAPDASESALPLASLEPEDWGLAEAGSDLLTAEERGEEPQAPALEADFDLAPAGSDMGQLKSDLPSVAPDISGLRLAD